MMKVISSIKYVKLIDVLAIFTLVGVCVFFGIQGNSKHKKLITPKTEQILSDNQLVKHSHQINGLHFTSFQKDKKVLDVKADEFHTRHKKVGFFRFGLMKEAVFKNAQIDLYLYGQNLKRTHEPDGFHFHAKYNPPDRTALEGESPGQPVPYQNPNPVYEFNFFRHLAGEITSQFKLNNVSRIILDPVCLRMINNGELVSKITADSTAINVIQRQILCKGTIRMESGEKLLLAEEMTIFAESGLIKPAGNYSFFINGQRYSGGRLLLDLLLNEASSTKIDNIQTAVSTNVKEKL